MIYVFQALACSLLWAGVTIASKLLAGKIPSFAFAFLRYGIAALCLLPFVFIKKEHETVKKRDLPTLFFLGFMLVFLFNALFFTALSYSSATSLSLIGATNPIMTMIASAIVFQHIPNRHQLFAFLLSFLGTALVITKGHMGLSVITGSIGELIMLVAVVCQVMYTMALKKVSSHYSPLFLSFATSLTGIFFVFPFIANKEFVAAVSNLSTTQWSLLLYISCIGTAFAIILFSTAIKHMGPARTSLTMFSSMPLFVFMLSYFFLGETITVWQVVGGLLVISSLVVGLPHTR